MENEELKLLRLYDFEYWLIPQLIEILSEQLPTTAAFVDYMSDIDWIVNKLLPQNNLECDFDASKIESSVAGVENINIVITYTFPEPQESPLAKFGAIVINTKGKNYYTLEKFMYKEDSGWMLGRKSNGCHGTIGRVDDCKTVEDFVRLLKQYKLLDTSIISKLRQKLFRFIR